jgi:hypothetical protein
VIVDEPGVLIPARLAPAVAVLLRRGMVDVEHRDAVKIRGELVDVLADLEALGEPKP